MESGYSVGEGGYESNHDAPPPAPVSERLPPTGSPVKKRTYPQNPNPNPNPSRMMLHEEKKKKNNLQEELEKLKAYYHEVCHSLATNQEKFNSELWEEKKNVLLKNLEKFGVTSDEVFQRYKPYDSRTELTEEEFLSNVLPDPKPKETGLPEKTEKPKIASLW
ncbi:unnamed protein product [Pleuronectes platessa]|uniref:Uncharacterized protein n=1 Tax=Pleuronectes platessa TaxID=8262 RepID=A0A9N7YA54_PLEPL|nr:unnamed protein product [Pleuronectes platessa]